jgi:hypothetical protein
MVTVGSDNPFPSILMVEGDPEDLASNPASGQRRLAVGTDHLLYLVDDAGDATLVGASGVTEIADLPAAETDTTLVLAPDGVGGVEWRAEGGSPFRALNFVIDGGGSVIATGAKGSIVMPWAWTDIAAAYLLADQSGSAVVDIWKDVIGSYPPVDADSITASAPPTLSSAASSVDSTLTGWTKTGSAGDILRFNVDSCTTITRLTVALILEL